MPIFNTPLSIKNSVSMQAPMNDYLIISWNDSLLQFAASLLNI